MAALAEIWTLTIVSIDRAQAIFHPIDTLKRMSSAQVSTPFKLENTLKIQHIKFLMHFFFLGSFVDRNHLDHCISFRRIPTLGMERIQLRSR